MNITPSLETPDRQASLLGTHFLTTAYGVSWLDQRMPPFTTEEFALLPFLPANINHHHSMNGTWTAHNGDVLDQFDLRFR